MGTAFRKLPWYRLPNVMILGCRDRKLHAFQKDLILEAQKPVMLKIFIVYAEVLSSTWRGKTRQVTQVYVLHSPSFWALAVIAFGVVFFLFRKA
jgi:hypothetical protein